MTGYVGLVMGLKFLVTALLLQAAGNLTGSSCGRCRQIGAAAVAAGFAGLCLVYPPAGTPVWHLLSLAMVGWAGFGRAWEAGLLYGVLTLLLGILAADLAAGRIPVVPGLGVWLLCRRGKTAWLELGYGSRDLRLRALRDTGNTLRDPVSGEPVAVISAGAAEELTGLTPMQLADPLTTLETGPLPGLRLIPYRSVGGRGLLLALRFPRGKLDGRRCRPLVAFAPEGLENSEYQALTGGGLGW